MENRMSRRLTPVSYGVEKLTTALSSLIGDGTLKDRLISAWRFSLGNIKPENLPAPADWAELKAMHDRFDREPESHEGTIYTAIHKMTAEEAGTHAEAIFSLCLRTRDWIAEG
jgi:hypothetical protein